MVSHFFLAVIIVSPFSSFLVTCSYGTFLESAVDIKVVGNNTVRSGMRQYTIYGGSSKLEYINCTVRKDKGELEDVTILKNGAPLSDSKMHGDVLQKTFTHNGRRNDTGIYKCRAIFEIESKSFKARYYVEKEVEVITVEETYLIASDVGSRVYRGEQISISCDGHYIDMEGDPGYSEYIEHTGYNWKLVEPIDSDYRDEKVCKVSLSGNPSSTIEIFGDDQINVTCDLRQFGQVLEDSYREQSLCSKPIYLTLDVDHELNVSLSPSQFNRFTKDLTFVCTSDPPRLVYWTVLTTDNGKIIDTQEPPAISANTKIYITQKPGESNLTIQIEGEEDERGNGIHTVMCSTYDTNAHVIKTSQRDLNSKFSSQYKVDGVSISLLSILFVFVTVLMLLVIFLVMRLHQIRALSLKSPDGSNNDDDPVPPETELQDNPAYLPYTEADP